jgi:hypothetical protein
MRKTASRKNKLSETGSLSWLPSDFSCDAAGIHVIEFLGFEAV